MKLRLPFHVGDEFPNLPPDDLLFSDRCQFICVALTRARLSSRTCVEDA